MVEVVFEPTCHALVVKLLAMPGTTYGVLGLYYTDLHLVRVRTSHVKIPEHR